MFSFGTSYRLRAPYHCLSIDVLAVYCSHWCSYHYSKKSCSRTEDWAAQRRRNRRLARKRRNIQIIMIIQLIVMMIIIITHTWQWLYNICIIPNIIYIILHNEIYTTCTWTKKTTGLLRYNQTHYDHDNPPPKSVQGYKFNIFYPDLIDKTKAPGIGIGIV